MGTLRAGLIGLPTAGKTTLFQLMTQGTAPASTSKFSRTDAQIGVSTVPDARLDELTKLFEPKKHVPATVTFADVIGNSSTQSLMDLAAFRESDALIHVVMAFETDAVPHPQGSIEPARDIQTVEDELILADLMVAEKRLERIKKDRKKHAGEDLRQEEEIVERCRLHLEKGLPIRSLSLDRVASKILRGFQFLSAKPLLLVINVNEEETSSLKQDDLLKRLGENFKKTYASTVKVCAKIELEIAQLEADDAQAFLQDLGLQRPGLERVVEAAYELLGYISFFTVGKDECRAWSIPSGTRAQQAAGEIHSDIERGFIRAEVVDAHKLLARGSMPACRENGELRLEGKDYIVQDGDVINFRFAT